MDNKKLEKLLDGIYEQTDKAFIGLSELIKQHGEIDFEPMKHIRRVRFVFLDSYCALKGEFISRVRFPEIGTGEELEVLFEYDNPEDDFNWHLFNWQDEFAFFNVCELAEGISELIELKMLK